MKKHFTVGMAGHIDHGKTSLTKALTNVDTDRLKEEKERQISIELGFAPLYKNESMQVSVIDVPGHERFIRQMIAGVAGIDLVVLVVAADEGVMPQTREHLEILSFLGVKKGIVAITKIDMVDDEFLSIVKEEILLELESSIFKDAPVKMVDSLSEKGIEELRETILSELSTLDSRDVKGAFRLPIDQVFTVKGQGTVVRGTVYEGSVEEGQTLIILPEKIETKARQLQVHHESSKNAYAGQRVAVNLSGIAKEDIERGDVLVSSEHFIVTNTIDVSLRMVDDLDYIVKQRMQIKCHIGTSEVMGRIVFFDRNEINTENDEILCQLRLEEEIVTKRGDRFILRRPSPQETIGGGWVIDPKGEKYRFGEETIESLAKKKDGNPMERVIAAILEVKGLSFVELLTRTSLDKEELVAVIDSEDIINYLPNHYTYIRVIEDMTEDLFDRILEQQNKNPMRYGINKAELVQEMQGVFPKQLIEYVLEEGETKQIWKREGQFLSIYDFVPHVPESWQKRVDGMLDALRKDGFQVRYLKDYYLEAGIPEQMQRELTAYLKNQQLIESIDEKFYVAKEHFNNSVNQLKEKTGTEFDVGEAKEILGLSRKLIIPLLEKLDQQKVTRRVENKRYWN